MLRWDFLVSVGAAALFLTLVLRSSRPLTDAGDPVAWATGVGIAIALGVAVAGRWLSDSTKDDALGELMRTVDPTGANSQRPFLIVVVVAIATSIWGAVLMVAGDEVSRSLAAWAYGLEVFLACYMLLGLLDALMYGFRQARRQAQLRALREQEARRKMS